MKRQFPAFRGIAILLVILNHAIHMGTQRPLELGYPGVEGIGKIVLITLSALGFVAVPIFLFISGSFFAYAAQASKGLTYKVVFANLRNILFPYLIWSLVFFALLYFGHQTAFTPVEYVKHLLVGYPFNFVPLIIFYFLVSPILVRLVDRIGWFPVILLISVYQILLILIVYQTTFNLAVPGWMSYLAPPVISLTLADWGIYFPAGLIFTMYMKDINPWVERTRWVAILSTLVFFVVTVLHGARVIDAAWSRHIFPLTFILLIPLIPRDRVPAVKWVETIGKSAYGLYLLHLIVIDILLLVLEAFVPAVMGWTYVLIPLLFLVGLFAPYYFMQAVARLPFRQVYRYLFG